MKIEEIKLALPEEMLSHRAWFRVPRTLVDIANRFDVSPVKVQEALDVLRSRGTMFDIRADGGVTLREILPPMPPHVHHTDKYFGGRVIRFGALGDNHMCSKHERMDVLQTLYESFKREGIAHVYNTGNWIDGDIPRINYNDLHTFGLDNQVNYFLKNYPRVPGITTHFITGDDHEGWFQKSTGVDIGQHAINLSKHNQYVECIRDDLEFIGFMEADIEFRNPEGNSAWMKVMHPGGGSAYAISYTIQKIIESFQPGEKPDVLLAGHYHKMDYTRPRDVRCFQTGCTQDQTPFMRKKRLDAHLGGWLIELHQDKSGAITKVRFEDYTFFDRKFYGIGAGPFQPTLPPQDIFKRVGAKKGTGRKKL